MNLLLQSFTLTALLTFPSTSTADQSEHIEFLKKANQISHELSQPGDSALKVVTKAENLFKLYEGDKEALDILSQLTAVRYSMVNEHAKSLKVADLGSSSSILEHTINDYNNYESSDAIKALVDEASSRQILMINEAHHIAQHRVLTFEMLEALWDIGYRYLALEALDAGAFPFEGPLNEKSGVYTNEPMFAYMIKRARAIGFQLISYDAGGSEIDEREKVAAHTIIKRIFENDEDAKVIIHVGYSHIDETNWLAGRLKEMLQIDPLTVDQVKISEKSESRFETGAYQELLSHYSRGEAFVLVDGDGSFYSSSPEKWDVSVIRPRTTYTFNKPDWMIQGRKIYRLNSSLCKGKFPCIAEVYDADLESEKELSKLVPLDRTIIFNNEEERVVLLEDGTGMLAVYDEDGQLLSKSLVSN